MSGLLAPPLALAGGSLIFLIFLIVFFFALVFGYYTRKGSGISQTPYRREGGPPESPSELTHDITDDVRNWERGTAGSHGRHRPPMAREPAELEVAEALREWREGSTAAPHLAPPVGPADHVYVAGSGATVAIYVDLASDPCRDADPERLRVEVGDGRYRARVVEQIHEATASGVHAIPALYINEARYVGVLDVDGLTRALT